MTGVAATLFRPHCACGSGWSAWAPARVCSLGPGSLCCTSWGQVQVSSRALSCCTSALAPGFQTPESLQSWECWGREEQQTDGIVAVLCILVFLPDQPAVILKEIQIVVLCIISVLDLHSVEEKVWHLFLHVIWRIFGTGAL